MAEEYEIRVQNNKNISSSVSSFLASGKIDIIEELNHSLSSKITQIPIEDGSSIVDHVRDKPKKVSVTIAVSNSSESQGEGGSSGKPKVAIQELMEIKKSRTFCTVTSFLNEYKDMLIEKILFSENSKTSQALFATITFKQVLVAVSAETNTNTDSVTRDDLESAENVASRNAQLDADEKSALEARQNAISLKEKESGKGIIQESFDNMLSMWQLILWSMKR